METLAHMATIICTFVKATLIPEQHFQVLGAACAAIQMASNGGLCLFQQDNTKEHSVRITATWLRSNRV